MIILPDPLRRALIDAAVAARPHECCGLLVGRTVDETTTVIDRIAPSRNVTLGAAASSFEIDPQLRLSLMRSLHGSGEAIIGHYHSHPRTTAEPSARDLSRVYEPDLVWLIIGLGSGSGPDLRAWRYDQEAAGFAPLPIASAAQTKPPMTAHDQKPGAEPPCRRS
ncbi:MAG: M67 family metallopeptidase [Defluviicoccus sp.]|nr:M67 family metallopeptidase [Defluviicoccus sp.]MDG4592060.1 M67 family metallopeptidase [Defluviicoccus sp.]